MIEKKKIINSFSTHSLYSLSFHYLCPHLQKLPLHHFVLHLPLLHPFHSTRSTQANPSLYPFPNPISSTPFLALLHLDQHPPILHLPLPLPLPHYSPLPVLKSYPLPWPPRSSLPSPLPLSPSPSPSLPPLPPLSPYSTHPPQSSPPNRAGPNLCQTSLPQNSHTSFRRTRRPGLRRTKSAMRGR